MGHPLSEVLQRGSEEAGDLGLRCVPTNSMYSRPRKETPRDTISYEIDMLEFCSQRLPDICDKSDPERNLYLEGFLLHYRNTIRFFSGKGHRKDDLSTDKPLDWADRELDAADVAEIKEPAKLLDGRYHSDVSKYLQHCTLQRSKQGRDWDVERMMQEINPIIAAFEAAFPR